MSVSADEWAKMMPDCVQQRILGRLQRELAELKRGMK